MTNRLLAKSFASLALAFILVGDGALDRPAQDLVTPLLARVPQAKPLLAFSGRGFAPGAPPFGQSDTQPAPDQPPERALDVRIPEVTSSAFLVGTSSRRARVPVKLGGARSAPLEVEAGRGVYRSVYEGVDLVAVRDPDYFELAFVVREPSRAPVLAFEVGSADSGERVSVEESSGAALVHNAAGRPLLRIEPPVAFDAAGVRRQGHYALLGSELSIALNLTDLTPPVVVDPRFAIPFWTLLSDARAPGALSYDKVSGSREIRLAFDEARGKAVLIRSIRSQQREDSTTSYAKLAFKQRSEGAGISPLLRVAPDGSVNAGQAERDDWNRSYFVESETWEWNGTGWDPRALPGLTGLIDPALAYDRGRQRLVVTTGAPPGVFCVDEGFILGFRGRIRCSLGQDDSTYELGPAGWRTLAIAAPPPPRVRAALAPFPPHQILFGGRALEPPPGFALIDAYGPPYPESLAHGLLNDTWRYDGERWEHVPTANPPSARENAQLVFDERRHRLVLVGGSDAGFDLWEFDGSDWVERLAAGDTALPAALRGRKQLLAAWNPARQTTLLFGGIAPKLESCALDDATVTARRRNPLKLEELAAAGCLGGYMHDSWEWDGQALRQLTRAAYSGLHRGIAVFRQLQTQDSWFAPGPSASPEPRRAGRPPLLPWRFDPDPAHFRLRSTLERAHAPGDLAPATTHLPASEPAPGAPSPGASTFVSPLFASDAQPEMVLDPVHSTALLVNPEDGRVFETNGATWSERTPAGSPFATGMQDFFAVTWDSAAQQMVLFDPRTAATWTHSDNGGWTRLTPSVSPPVWSVDPEIRRERDVSSKFRDGSDSGRFADVARRIPQMTFDRARSRTVLLHAGALWEFDGSTWLQSPAPPGWETCQSATLLAYDGLRSRVVALGCKLPGTTMEWDGSSWQGPFPAPYSGLQRRVQAFVNGRATTVVSAWQGTLQMSWEHPNAFFESPSLGGVSTFDGLGKLQTWDGTTWHEGPALPEATKCNWTEDLDSQYQFGNAPPFNVLHDFTGQDFAPMCFFPPAIEDSANHRILVFRDGVDALRELRLGESTPRWGELKVGDDFDDGRRVHPHPFELLSAEHVTLSTLTDPLSVQLLQYDANNGLQPINRQVILPRESARVPESLVNNLFWPFRLLPDPVSKRVRVLTHRGAVWELGSELRTGPGDACASTADCGDGVCSAEGVCCNSKCDLECSTCMGSNPGRCERVATGLPDPLARCGTGPCAGVCSGQTPINGGSRCVYDPTCTTPGPGKDPGEACTTSADCAAGACSSEGVCCDSVCNGPCLTCLGSQPGRCEAIPAGAPDPLGRCGSGDCAGVCSGLSAQPGVAPNCAYDSTRQCGPAPICANGIFTPGGHCAADAASCVSTGLTPAPCAGNLPCQNGAACKATCNSSADCSGPYLECNTTSHSCEPDAVSVAATARGVQPSDWVPQTRRTPEQLADFLRQHGFESDTQGRILFSEFAMGGVTLAFDPHLKTPVTGFDNCIDRIQACDVAKRSLDACVAAMPRCASPTPWLDDPAGFDCCPSACLLEYFDLRESYPPGRALVSLINSLCYPGLQTYLEGLQ